METEWLDNDEIKAWVRLIAVLELLPGQLDSQLRRDSSITHFEYYVLAMLSESKECTLRMTTLAAQTNATLPRLSHVVRRLEGRGLATRFPCPTDARATNVRLTDEGRNVIQAAAPGHVATVRRLVIDALDADQVAQLADIGQSLLARIDPDGTMATTYTRYDEPDETT